MPKSKSKSQKNQKSSIATPPMVPAVDKAFDMGKSKPKSKAKKGKC